MKKSACIILVTIFICYIFSYLSITKTPVHQTFAGNMPGVSRFEQREAELFEFIKRHLLGENGEIFSNTGPYGSKRDTLSESIGLVMEYSILKNDKALFEKEYAFLKANMLEGGSFVRWISGRGMASCNAAIDDLRIIRALSDAGGLWNSPDYYNMAGFIQKGIYERQVIDNRLHEFYDWSTDSVRKSIPLCYLDLYTMDRAADFNQGWQNVINRSCSIINKGRIGNSPFFYKYFDYETQNYFMDEEFQSQKGICLTYSLYTVLHLMEMNEDTDFFMHWLKEEMGKGKLFAWYDPETLTPSQNIESTAVYALAAAYAYRMGEKKFCTALLDRMLRFMITDKKSLYYGGFGDEEIKNFYAFDNLTALLALAHINK